MPNPLYLQFVAYLEAAQEQNRDRIETLTRQVDAAQREIAGIRNFEEFTAELQRRVESGQVAVEAALVELVPRHFSASESVSNLHEFSPRKRAC